MNRDLNNQYDKKYYERVEIQNNDTIRGKTFDWMFDKTMWKYQYNFNWLNFPIVQYPQDVLAFQELIWYAKPDLIIETGVSQGGSVMFSASILAMIEYEEAYKNNTLLDPNNPNRMVLGIDIFLEEHTKKELENNALSKRIKILNGSSTDESIIKQVHEYSKNFNNIMVFLDSDHRCKHVLEELNNYASLVTIGNYCIVGDTIVEYMPEGAYVSRGWGRGNNPKNAVDLYLKENDLFEIDETIQNKLLITSCINGFLKRVK
jgi:cephalosporin hydroxylase